MNDAPDLSHSTFETRVPVWIRRCHAEDLPELEWCGVYREHRAIAERTFAAMQAGTQRMWVADVGGFPVGQIWLDLARDRLWAARVFPAMRGRGIGSRLARVAERELVARFRQNATVAVEVANSAAVRFWMREGYHVVDLVHEAWSHVTPDGVHVEVQSSLQVLGKDLTEVTLARNPLDRC
jgi:ribosomal protein S18 acetylase RimI-like enzyme